MKIETDRAEIVAGVRHSHTIGSPVAIIIRNKDWQNWTEALPVEDIDGGEDKKKPVPCGHKDCILALWLVSEFERSFRAMEMPDSLQKPMMELVTIMAEGIMDGIPEIWNDDNEYYNKMATEEVAMLERMRCSVGSNPSTPPKGSN
jgi:hypothetical protein